MTRRMNCFFLASENQENMVDQIKGFPLLLTEKSNLLLNNYPDHLIPHGPRSNRCPGARLMLARGSTWSDKNVDHCSSSGLTQTCFGKKLTDILSAYNQPV